MKTFKQHLAEAVQHIDADEHELNSFKRTHADVIKHTVKVVQDAHKKLPEGHAIGFRSGLTKVGVKHIDHTSYKWSRSDAGKGTNVGFKQHKEKHAGLHFTPIHDHSEEGITKALQKHHKFYATRVTNPIVKGKGRTQHNNLHIVSGKVDDKGTKEVNSHRTPEEQKKYPEAMSHGKLTVHHSFHGEDHGDFVGVGNQAKRSHLARQKK